MTVVIPSSVTAEGNVNAIFAPAIASMAAPTVLELTATGSVDISAFLMPDWDGPSAAQKKGESRRFASKQSFERLGRVSWTLAELVYTYLPQTALTDPANKAYAKLTSGIVGFVAIRYGLATTVALAAAQKVDVFPVECGLQRKSVQGSDEFAPLTVLQELGVTGIPVPDAVVA